MAKFTVDIPDDLLATLRAAMAAEVGWTSTVRNAQGVVVDNPETIGQATIRAVTSYLKDRCQSYAVQQAVKQAAANAQAAAAAAVTASPITITDG